MMKNLMPALLNRKAQKDIEGVLPELPLGSGSRVADLGCGGGAFTIAFAERIGENGEVYAVDVESSRLEYVEKCARKHGLTRRIIFVLAEQNDCLLPKDTFDLVFSRNAYHHIENPAEYFKRAAAALKSSGALAVIDHDGSRRGFGPSSHWSDPENIRRDIETCGLVFHQSYEHLAGASFQIFRAARGQK